MISAKPIVRGRQQFISALSRPRSALSCRSLIVSRTCSPLLPAGILVEIRFPFFGSAVTTSLNNTAFRVSRLCATAWPFDAEELKSYARRLGRKVNQDVLVRMRDVAHATVGL